MELFDVVNAIFHKTKWKEVPRTDKDRYFFMINRFLSIGLPRQASMFNIKHIPKEHVLDYWNRQLSRLYNKIPDWIYTKGQKASKNEINETKIDAEIVKLYCEFNKCSQEEFKMILKYAPKMLEEELPMYTQLLKSRKNIQSTNEE
jgi:hypothetical protein